jgi:enamine deaminase RidA (YjgF/YER057c/UK114 family)
MHRPTGYSHVAEVMAGRPVYIAGQVALDPTGALVGPGDVRAQARQVFENLRVALQAVGVGFDQVVKLNYYLVDASQLPAVREVRDQYVNPRQLPASTAVEVRRLFREDLLIEVEAVAVAPSPASRPPKRMLKALDERPVPLAHPLQRDPAIHRRHCPA